MLKKNLIRKKYLEIRKKKYFEIENSFFNPLKKLIKYNFLNKKINLAIYYPSLFELNVLKIVEDKYIIKKNLLLPRVSKSNFMYFCKWKKNEILVVNKYGMLEPIKSKIKIPDLMLVPLLAFDKNKYRLGYGKGFYDRYLNVLLKKFNKILTVGVAFSFQRYHKLPLSSNDVKLDFILTEKGMMK
jgi:5-formyltetrahydrofolate cyclo-ligase